jgi:hypothetical protein
VVDAVRFHSFIAAGYYIIPDPKMSAGYVLPGVSGLYVSAIIAYPLLARCTH